MDALLCVVIGGAIDRVLYRKGLSFDETKSKESLDGEVQLLRRGYFEGSHAMGSNTSSNGVLVI